MSISQSESGEMTATIGTNGTETTVDRQVSVKSYSTYFPSGLFGSAVLHANITNYNSYLSKLGQVVTIRNGLDVVWQGVLDDVTYPVSRNSKIILSCTGWWGWLSKFFLDRRYADDRQGRGAWHLLYFSDSERATYKIDTSGMTITPKAVAWANNDSFWVRYVAPLGETVDRVAGTYDFTEEAAQSWQMLVRENTTPFHFLQVTATGTGSFDTDHTGTPRQPLYFILQALAAQTASSDGQTLAKLPTVMVYRYTSVAMPTVYAYAIVTDIISQMGSAVINPDTTLVADNIGSQITLEPFYTVGPEPITSIMERAVAFGDSSNNAMYVRALESSKAASDSGLPVIELANWPSTSSPDYSIKSTDDNVRSDITISVNTADIANYIITTRPDPVQEGEFKTYGPVQDSTLKDTTSITKFGQREFYLDLSGCSQSMALAIGKRYKEKLKNPQVVVSDIVLTGWIKRIDGSSKSYAMQHVSLIRAGEIIKLEDVQDDISPESFGLETVTLNGFSFIITHTDYDAETETMRLKVGIPTTIDLAIASAERAVGLYKPLTARRG